MRGRRYFSSVGTATTKNILKKGYERPLIRLISEISHLSLFGLAAPPVAGQTEPPYSPGNINKYTVYSLGLGLKAINLNGTGPKWSINLGSPKNKKERPCGTIYD